MKIECSACSKKYDPVATAGTCPYCGMHATDEQIANAQTNDVIKGGSVKEMLRSYLNEKIRKDKKTSPLRKTSIQLGICTLLVAAMIGVAFWGNNHYKKRLDLYLNNNNTSDMKIVQRKTGDSIEVKGDVVRFISCKALPELQSKVEGPFRLVEVKYSDSGMDAYKTLSGVYIITEKGATARCLDLYDVSALLDVPEQELKFQGYADGMHSTALDDRGKSGSYSMADNTYKLIFAVPENETEHTFCVFGSDSANILRYDITMKEDE